MKPFDIKEDNIDLIESELVEIVPWYFLSKIFFIVLRSNIFLEFELNISRIAFLSDVGDSILITEIKSFFIAS